MVGREATITDLKPGRAYEIAIKCHNSLGWGEAGAVSQAIWTDATLCPGIPFATQRSDTYVVVNWLDPEPPEGETEIVPIDRFEVQVRKVTTAAGIETCCEWSTSSENTRPPYLLGGLAPLSVYQFRVRAHNSIIEFHPWGAWSPASDQVRTRRRF